MSDEYRVLIRKSEGNRLLWRIRYRRDDIEIDVRGPGYKGVDWNYVVQNRD
jgi:hypothetical protein